MEVLSACMPPAFKGEDNWKHKRVYDNKHVKQADVKVEHRPERSLCYDGVAMRENNYKRLHAGGVNSWDGFGSQSSASRSMGRANLEDASWPHGYMRKPEVEEESSDDPESSHDVHPDESDDAGDDEPVSPLAAAPQKWPIIQIVAPPPWLPEGWTAVLRTRESGSKDKYYVDPVSQRRFRSKTEVNYFLQTGKSYRYKRNLALLTKPLKEDPVSLPSSVSLRNVHVELPNSRESVQTLPFMSPSAVYGGEHRGSSAGQSRSSLSPDLRLSMLPPHAEQPRKSYNKPGPKPKIKTFLEDSSAVISGSKRGVMDETKSLDPSQIQGTENRGKLILKLKRKTAELDEGERNGKKPRPFEVVGAIPVLLRKSSSTCDEEDMHLTVESSSRAPVPHSLVPSTHLSRRPMTKAPLPFWQYQPHLSALSRPQFSGSGNVVVNSNGQGDMLEKNFATATSAITVPETSKGPSKRESPAEQLQKLGRKLCQQAINVLLSSEYGGSSTVQQVSFGLDSSTSHGLNSGFNTQINVAFDSGFQSPYQQFEPTKRMRGSVVKDKGTLPMQHSLVPHSH